MKRESLQKDRKPAPLVEFHGDDYGLFTGQSRRILACREQGCLNGVSCLFNSGNIEQCVSLLRPYLDGMAVSVHLDLVEGRSLCPPETVDLLVDENGVFCRSFVSLLIRPLFAWGRYKSQIKRELLAQIDAARRLLGGDRPLRLDGHCHYHMLPVVFDAMMEVLAETGYPVEYIRIPRERYRLYLRCRRQLEGFRPVNLLKSIVLNLLAGRNVRRHRAQLEGHEKRLFVGVMFSGHMSERNVRALLPEAAALAGRLGMGVELLAHPGAVPEAEDAAALTSRGDAAFMADPMRREEARMFCALRQEAEKYL